MLERKKLKTILLLSSFTLTTNGLSTPSFLNSTFEASSKAGFQFAETAEDQRLLFPPETGLIELTANAADALSVCSDLAALFRLHLDFQKKNQLFLTEGTYSDSQENWPDRYREMALVDIATTYESYKKKMNQIDILISSATSDRQKTRLHAQLASFRSLIEPLKPIMHQKKNIVSDLENWHQQSTTISYVEILRKMDTLADSLSQLGSIHYTFQQNIYLERTINELNASQDGFIYESPFLGESLFDISSSRTLRNIQFAMFRHIQLSFYRWENHRISAFAGCSNQNCSQMPLEQIPHHISGSIQLNAIAYCSNLSQVDSQWLPISSHMTMKFSDPTSSRQNTWSISARGHVESP